MRPIDEELASVRTGWRPRRAIITRAIMAKMASEAEAERLANEIDQLQEEYETKVMRHGSSRHPSPRPLQQWLTLVARGGWLVRR